MSTPDKDQMKFVAGYAPKDIETRVVKSFLDISDFDRNEETGQPERL